jgi:hypothetical protein
MAVNKNTEASFGTCLERGTPWLFEEVVMHIQDQLKPSGLESPAMGLLLGQ